MHPEEAVPAEKGVDSGMISSSIMPFIVLMIVVTSFLTPILLKNSMRQEIAVAGADAPGVSGENESAQSADTAGGADTHQNTISPETGAENAPSGETQT